MIDIIKTHEDVWGDDPRGLLADYKYQPELTKKLDEIDGANLDELTLMEMVLWKVNRYPQIAPSLMIELKGVVGLEPKEHRKAAAVLSALLNCHGIRLPMASTLLRFLNPQVFQIIDNRVFRVIFPHRCSYPDKPTSKAKLKTYVSESISIYFEYLDELHKHASENLPFYQADRILYVLDRKLNNKIRKQKGTAD